jgi:DUF971 family protein
MSYGTEVRPTEIRLKKSEKALEIDFDDGASFRFPAEFLRVFSPSAEVRGHGPGEETLVAGRKHVGIIEVEAVGNYAIVIRFDDMHDTGIYSWEYLHELGQTQDEKWARYLKRMEDAGESREP